MALAGLAAGPWFALVLALFAAPLPGYRHALHPPAILGASGYAGATAWNVLGFGLTGALALLGAQGVSVALRQAGAGMPARIGVTLMLLAGLAFSAQGVFPLDLQQAIDVGPNRRHIAAWSAWWIAAGAGAAITALGVRALPHWRSLAVAGVLAAGLVFGAVQADLDGIGLGWRQRIALAAWFGWLGWGSWLALRRAPRAGGCGCG